MNKIAEEEKKSRLRKKKKLVLLSQRWNIRQTIFIGYWIPSPINWRKSLQYVLTKDGGRGIYFLLWNLGMILRCWKALIHISWLAPRYLSIFISLICRSRAMNVCWVPRTKVLRVFQKLVTRIACHVLTAFIFSRLTFNSYSQSVSVATLLFFASVDHTFKSMVAIVAAKAKTRADKGLMVVTSDWKRSFK